jgi:hypothetical protein
MGDRARQGRGHDDRRRARRRRSRHYGWLDVRGVDPFTQGAEPILAGRAIGGSLDVRIARSRFADTPRTSGGSTRPRRTWLPGRQP